jgi:hypothetical protein
VKPQLWAGRFAGLCVRVRLGCRPGMSARPAEVQIELDHAGVAGVVKLVMLLVLLHPRQCRQGY